MLFGILVATPLHDSMVTVSGILMLISLFYIAVFVFKSKLTLLKILAIIVIVLFEVCNYLYYTRSRLDLLPVAQKATLLAGLVWILSLQYFTKRKDFQAQTPTPFSGS
jgi:ABC-type iron transport system FetAB permease component